MCQGVLVEEGNTARLSSSWLGVSISIKIRVDNEGPAVLVPGVELDSARSASRFGGEAEPNRAGMVSSSGSLGHLVGVMLKSSCSGSTRMCPSKLGCLRGGLPWVEATVT